MRRSRSAAAAPRAPARVADAGGGLPRHRHPGRQRRARAHLRPRQPARHARLRGRQDRHQQGHARQLVRRLHRPLHGRRLGRQRQRRGDARRQRRQRRRAGLAGAGAAPARGRAVARAARAPPGVVAHASRSTRSASRRATSVPRRHRAGAQRAGAQVPRAQRFGIASPRDGSVFALDPDMPPAAQRITFEGDAGRVDARRQAPGQRPPAALGAVAGPARARRWSARDGAVVADGALRGARRAASRPRRRAADQAAVGRRCAPSPRR